MVIIMLVIIMYTIDIIAISSSGQLNVDRFLLLPNAFLAVVRTGY